MYLLAASAPPFAAYPSALGAARAFLLRVLTSAVFRGDGAGARRSSIVFSTSRRWASSSRNVAASSTAQSIKPCSSKFIIALMTISTEGIGADGRPEPHRSGSRRSAARSGQNTTSYVRGRPTTSGGISRMGSGSGQGFFASAAEYSAAGVLTWLSSNRTSRYSPRMSLIAWK